MTQSSEPASLSAPQKEAFTVLLLRYLDDDCSADEIDQLRGVLADVAPYRELFVQICRMKGNLHEAYSPKRAKLHSTRQTAEIQNDFPVNQELAADEVPADPNAETMIGKLSVEDTANPLPKPPASKGTVQK
jgi:hypothetical protein